MPQYASPVAVFPDQEIMQEVTAAYGNVIGSLNITSFARTQEHPCRSETQSSAPRIGPEWNAPPQ